jgi:hypothetical protein
MQQAKERSSEAVDAAQAFEDLRSEVSVLRRAVEALPGEWEANQPPDYTPTLGSIAKGLKAVADRLQSIEGHPALRITPDQHQQAIAKAGNNLMQEAGSKLYAAGRELEQTREHLAALIGSARTQDKQRRWLAITAAAALVVGLLLSPFAVRLLPFGWDAGVAASILGTDRWNAGQQLMKSTNPTGWETLAAEITLAEANHDALSACRAAAAQTKKEQRCTIVVPPP